jgi:hypothetical protein
MNHCSGMVANLTRLNARPCCISCPRTFALVSSQPCMLCIEPLDALMPAPICARLLRLCSCSCNPGYLAVHHAPVCPDVVALLISLWIYLCPIESTHVPCIGLASAPVAPAFPCPCLCTYALESPLGLLHLHHPSSLCLRKELVVLGLVDPSPRLHSPPTPPPCSCPLKPTSRALIPFDLE